ncbi:MAG: hypothetical protein ABIH26_08745 [Candidatus Eisenbacteria bacterium]
MRTAMSARARVRRLERIRNRFSPEEREEKRALLSSLKNAEILDPLLLFRYHEALLFVRSYPDDAGIFALARAECARFAARVDRLRRRAPAAADDLDDTGIVGTITRYAYDFVTARALLRRPGDALEIDWDGFEKTENLDMVLPFVAQWMENDGLDLAEVSTEEWVEQAKGDPSKPALSWLLGGIDAIAAPHPVKRHLFDSMEIPILWRLGGSSSSRTKARLASAPVFFHEEPLLRRIDGFWREVARPMPAVETAPRREARRLIRLAVSSLAVRHRALYPIEYPNPDDVLVVEPGRGYRFLLYGMQPGYRLPFESDYGALLLKNGYPIGYGVGAMLFDQMEIAVNIFDSWRGGEAGFLFAQFVRAFRSHFGCARFKIDRYQVGHENDEGLKSGSFWFYYKLGFRPKDPECRRLAEREAARIRRSPRHRSDLATLKRLARSDLYCSIRGAPGKIPDDFPLVDLSMRTTRMIAERFDGDRRKASRASAERMAEVLDSPGWKRWPRAEREWFERLSVAMALIPRLETWPLSERRDLAALVRAKGMPSETEFARRMVKQGKLRAALARIARR